MQPAFNVDADDFPVLLAFSRIDNYSILDEGVRTQIKRAYELSVWSSDGSYRIPATTPTGVPGDLALHRR
jgi:hypothetical protein